MPRRLASAAPSALCAAVGRSKPSATSRRAARRAEEVRPRRARRRLPLVAGGASASVFAAGRLLAGAAGFLATRRARRSGAGAHLMFRTPPAA